MCQPEKLLPVDVTVKVMNNTLDNSFLQFNVNKVETVKILLKTPLITLIQPTIQVIILNKTIPKTLLLLSVKPLKLLLVKLSHYPPLLMDLSI